MVQATVTRDERLTATALLDDALGEVVIKTGYPAEHVRLFVEPAIHYVLREYGGDRLPKARRSYPAEEIVAMLQCGATKAAVCRRFRIGRSTLYRIISRFEASIEVEVIRNEQ